MKVPKVNRASKIPVCSDFNDSGRIDGSCNPDGYERDSKAEAESFSNALRAKFDMTRHDPHNIKIELSEVPTSNAAIVIKTEKSAPSPKSHTIVVGHRPRT